VSSYTFPNVTANHTISATFGYVPPTPAYTLTVSKSGTGSGTVTGSGIDCGSDCSETYNENTTATLTASADAGSRFAGWEGCDSVSEDHCSCSVTMSSSRSVTATFTRAGLIAADFDGDGKSDYGLYRKTDGYWEVMYSSWGTETFTWGGPQYELISLY